MNSPLRLSKQELEAEMFRANTQLQISHLRQRIDNSFMIGHETYLKIYKEGYDFKDHAFSIKFQKYHDELFELIEKVNHCSRFVAFGNDCDLVKSSAGLLNFYQKKLTDVNKAVNRITAIHALLFTQLTGWNDS